jgi:hypothetical protein
MTQASVDQSARPNGGSTLAAVRSLAVTIALTLMIVALWSLTRHHRAFSQDGELYAVQALARIHPALGMDVYLADVSQDRYTVFSRIYAALIGCYGLNGAELLLFVVCTLWFFTASWALARNLSGSGTAWLATAMLMVAAGSYGAYGIFQFSENYLTARSLAEALVVTSLALHFHGWRRLALGLAVGTLFIHPLMALPGVLLLICLWLPVRRAIWGSVAGVLGVLGIAVFGVLAPGAAHVLTIMDGPWLEVVRERSQFLFFKYWSIGDWEMHARPFLCLTMSALVLDEDRIRKLLIASMLVGAAGLLVAFIACTIGPVAILLQGQAWRWFWVTGFASLLLLVPTVLRVWREEKCGPMCAILLIAGWTFAPVHGIALIALALFLWLLRPRIEGRTGMYLRWGALALFAVIVSWMLVNSWSLLTSPRVIVGPESLLIDRIRSFLGLQVSAVLVFGFSWYFIRSARTAWMPATVAMLLTVTLILVVPSTFARVGTSASRVEFDEFAEWRNAIPPAGNVLILPTRKSAAFAWFTLERPSYISVDQSAGVVYSSATAQEIRRRSEVLLPVAEPDWKILSQIQQEARGKKLENLTRPLTAKSLVEVCADPLLGFVVARESVGFEPLRHPQPGAWKDWNLYDCRRVRSTASAT